MLFALVRGTQRFQPPLNAELHGSGKVVSAVCHGPAGLLEVKLGDDDYLISGKDATGFSRDEKYKTGREQAVPYSLEAELRKEIRKTRNPLSRSLFRCLTNPAALPTEASR